MTTVSNAAVSKARAELNATLSAISDKLDVATRVKNSYKENSLPWLLAGVGVVAVVGGSIAWAIFGSDKKGR